MKDFLPLVCTAQQASRSAPTRRAVLVGGGLGGWVGGPFTTPLAHAADAALRDGDIVLYRHANAPGIGDPPQLRLGDCSTQRNLDDSGRAQARRIGEALRARLAAGLRVAAVWHSQWCRCRETAALAFPGLPLRAVPAFNSFFADRGEEPRRTRSAQAELRRWSGPGLLVVVTHQVNLQALLGEATSSGEGLVVRWNGDRLALVQRLAPPA